MSGVESWQSSGQAFDGHGFESDDASAFDVKELIVYGATRSLGLILVFIAIGGAAGLIAGALIPNTYESKALLKFRSGARQTLTAESAVAAADERTAARNSTLDEIRLLRNPAIYEDVALRLRPSSVFELADPTQFDTPETSLPVRLLHQLQAKLIAVRASGDECEDEFCDKCVRAAGEFLRDSTALEIPDRFSSLISVKVASSSAERAQELSRELIASFVEAHAAVYSTQPYVERNERLMNEALDTKKRAEDSFLEHRKECGFFDLEKDKTLYHSRFASAETDLEVIRARRQELLEQLRHKQAALDETPRWSEEVIPAKKQRNKEYTLRYEEWSALLRTKIDWDQQRPNTTKQAWTDRAVSLKQELDAAEARLNDVPYEIVVEPESTRQIANPEYAVLNKEILDLEAEDKGLGAKYDARIGDRKLAQGKLDLVLECENLHAVYRQEIGAHEERVEGLNREFDRLSRLRALDEDLQVNLIVAQEPTLPSMKSGPQRMKYLLLGLFGGAAVGFALGALRHLLDRRIRYPEFVERSLGVPTLSVVPYSRGIKSVGRMRAKASAG